MAGASKPVNRKPAKADAKRSGVAARQSAASQKASQTAMDSRYGVRAGKKK